MREIFEQYGLLQPLPKLQAAEQVSIPSQALSFGGYSRTKGTNDPRKLRRDWRTLLKLSETPIASRAISLIVDKIASLEYVLGPKPAFADTNTDYAKEIDTVRMVLENPNIEDENWSTVTRQLVEDLLVFDFGCFEYVEDPQPAPMPNDLLALIPVPGWSIERTIAWNGEADKPRWIQQGSSRLVPLLDSQIEAIIMRKRTSVSYGLSPLEVAIGLMDSYLKLSSYQASIASEAYPAFILSLGPEANQDYMDRLRMYWKNDIAGQGRPGFIGGTTDPTVLQTKALTDDGMYLKYYEILIRAFAFSFKLKGQDFNIERDVNKSQGVISQAASIEESIRPYAVAIANRTTHRIIPRIAAITGNAKILELQYEYSNIDPWDEMEQTNLATVQWQANGITRGEYRQKLGYDKADDGTDDMCFDEFAAQFGGAASEAPITDQNDSTNKNASAVEDPKRQLLAQLLISTRRKKKE